MGWNDHDDRLMELAYQFEMAGVEYDRAYERALEIRTDEMISGDFVSMDSVFQMIDEELENA